MLSCGKLGHFSIVAIAAEFVPTALEAVERVSGGHPLALVHAGSLVYHYLVHVLRTQGLPALGIEGKGQQSL